MLGGEELLDFGEYQKVYCMSLYEMIQHSIDLTLFPKKFEDDNRWKKHKSETTVSVPHVL